MQKIYEKDRKMRRLWRFVSKKFVYFIKCMYLCTRICKLLNKRGMICDKKLCFVRALVI